MKNVHPNPHLFLSGVLSRKHQQDQTTSRLDSTRVVSTFLSLWSHSVTQPSRAISSVRSLSYRRTVHYHYSNHLYLFNFHLPTHLPTTHYMGPTRTSQSVSTRYG